MGRRTRGAEARSQGTVTPTGREWAQRTTATPTKGTWSAAVQGKGNTFTTDR